MAPRMTPDLILHNGRITTQDPARPEAQALAIHDGRIEASGSNDAILAMGAPDTPRIDLRDRRVIPGLHDSHLHVIRAGLFSNLELRWDGVPTLAQALLQLKEQAARTPPPQWVRVIGGWNEFQFAEGRMPTLDELNKAAPDTPVFVLHLYDSALLNRAALRVLGMDGSTPNPPGGLIVRDASGQPTGLLLAEPNALILYSTIARAPKLSPEDQANSTRHFMRELNRFGVTSVSDAGGGGQNYPEDYAIIQQLRDADQLTLRIAYSLFAQKAGTEFADYTRWIGLTPPGAGDALLKMHGAGENLLWSAADFENFLQPRPDLKPTMEQDLHAIVRLLVESRWPWRIHATYDETIRRFLDVFERVNRDLPFNGLRWFIDHAETIAPATLDRVAALGGGIAIQHRMAYQGEYFVRRYGAASARLRPPLKEIMARGIPLGAGTDGTRVASYHPWTCLWWMVTGQTVGGLRLQDAAECLSREEALRLYTQGSAWFSSEEQVKGRLAPGCYADLAVLSDDYFTIEADAIRGLTSVLTLLGGKVVYGAGEFAALAPALPPVSPDWSPVKHYGGYAVGAAALPIHAHMPIMSADGRVWESGCGCAV